MRHTSPKWLNGISSVLTRPYLFANSQVRGGLRNADRQGSLGPLDKGTGEILVLLSLQ